MADDIYSWKEKLVTPTGAHIAMEQKEEIQKLRKAIRKLDPDKREVLVLARLHGMKYREIAQIMGISEGNVKVRMFRAMKDLRYYFKNAQG